MSNIAKGVYDVFIGPVCDYRVTQYGNVVREAVLVFRNGYVMNVRSEADSAASIHLANAEPGYRRVTRANVTINGRGTISKVEPIEVFTYDDNTISNAHPALGLE